MFPDYRLTRVEPRRVKVLFVARWEDNEWKKCEAGTHTKRQEKRKKERKKKERKKEKRKKERKKRGRGRTRTAKMGGVEGGEGTMAPEKKFTSITKAQKLI